MSQPTCPPAQIVADTIVRTVELGVRITDAALDGETTVLWCDLLTDGPGVCPGWRVIGVDEHKWAHVFGAEGGGFVTVITDLTEVVAGQGRARLLDLVPGRSAAAMRTWLQAREASFREQVRVVAMDGFGGYKNAAT